MQGYIGVIKYFAGTFAPKDWQFCQGQMLKISDYTPLYAIIANRFGGDGISTFALPNLAQKVAVGTGRGPGLNYYTLAKQGGVSEVTLGMDQMPSHNHTIKASNTIGEVEPPVNNFPAISNGELTVGRTKYPYTNNAYSTNSFDLNMSHNSINNSGKGEPHENMQPYTVCNYIICLDGLFPRRS